MEECNWRTFDQFTNCAFGYWKITIKSNANESNWKKSTCTSPIFYKQYICKHIIAICILLNKVGSQMPFAAKNLPIGQKRKAGRPAHAALALCRQRQFTSLREDLENLSDLDSDEETSTTNTNETSHDASIADIVIAHNLEQNVYSDYVAPVNLGNRDCEFDATDLDSVIC